MIRYQREIYCTVIHYIFFFYYFSRYNDERKKLAYLSYQILFTDFPYSFFIKKFLQLYIKDTCIKIV